MKFFRRNFTSYLIRNASHLFISYHIRVFRAWMYFRNFPCPTNKYHCTEIFLQQCAALGFLETCLPSYKKRRPLFCAQDFGKDMLNCLIGMVWQSSMIVLPIFLLIRDYPKTLMALLVFLTTSILLKYTWLDKVRRIPN